MGSTLVERQGFRTFTHNRCGPKTISESLVTDSQRTSLWEIHLQAIQLQQSNSFSVLASWQLSDTVTKQATMCIMIYDNAPKSEPLGVRRRQMI